ncbi:MAG: AGE family epimerase/isomerase [Kiritimatiellae bacterium]|nr:AGE family epimerase/isomerase [Kiritimatiellia bacterium]
MRPSPYWQNWSKTCKDELLTNIMPFWMKNGWDRKHGGVYTCLDRDGTRMDTTKAVWFQGRFGWLTAHACNRVRKNAQWLAASRSCCAFLEEHCFDTDGRAFFEVTEDGRGLRKRRYLFSECFAAMAYAEYALASGDSAWAEKAVALFKRIRAFMADPEKWMPPKYTAEMRTQGHSLTMILINVANVLKQISDDPVLDRQISESIDHLTAHFIHPEFKALLETVGPNGEFIDTLAGRVINPGHCIETSWFLMDVAVARKDNALLKTALQILDWSWAWGWDRKYGGIISFKDCRNLPPQSYEQDMKFWWPQCEAIIACAYAYKLTGNAKYLNRHKRVAEWAWAHLKDRKYPEWYGYLHRDGTVAQPAKGNLFKGPFHIPRMLIRTWELANGE